ncbi:MAG: biotin/lipoyl-containing protein [Erysipelotrichaceae bacterium]|jgi:biotin carboxyl carrier protein
MKIYKVKVNGKYYEVEVSAAEEVASEVKVQPQKAENVVSQGDNIILAPIAGKVLEVKVNVGDIVKKGQTVAVIEAMKLENEIQSAYDGRVSVVNIKKGDDVNNKDELIVLK